MVSPKEIRAFLLIFAILFARPISDTGSTQLRDIPPVPLEEGPKLEHMVKKAIWQDEMPSKDEPLHKDLGPMVKGEFYNVSLREALMDLSKQTGIPILIAGEVEGVANLNLNEIPLEIALQMLTIPNGYDLFHLNGAYVVGSVEGNFPKVSVAKIYEPRALIVDDLANLLPDSYYSYISYNEDVFFIKGPPSMVRRIEDDLYKIDIPARRILLEVRVVQLPLTDTSKFGLQWTELFNSGFQRGLGELDEILDAAIKECGGSIQIRTVLNLLEGRESTLHISRKTSVKAGYTPLQVKTSFKFKGYITQTNEITFKISPDITIVDATDGELGLVHYNKISTQARVKSGETFILGGMLDTVRLNQVLGTSPLSQVPYIGRLFSWDEVIQKEIETLVIVTPWVVDA